MRSLIFFLVFAVIMLFFAISKKSFISLAIAMVMSRKKVDFDGKMIYSLKGEKKRHKREVDLVLFFS